MVSIESLQLRVSQLEDELEERTANLYKAAECGNSLLSTNQLLNDKLEAWEEEHSKELEVKCSSYVYCLKLIFLHTAH